MNSYIDDAIRDFLSTFMTIGGVVDFSFFERSRAIVDLRVSEYLEHKEIARETIHNHTNKVTTFDKCTEQKETICNTVKGDDSISSLSGIKISTEEFLGPYFDTNQMKPLIKGSTMLNHYFYFDQEENENNIIDIDTVIQNFKKEYLKVDNGFTYAFLEPPYGLYGLSPYEKGKLFLETLTILFSNINELVIYKWNTDFSPYFDPGREWWGCYFFTVYNPEKDIYIGITASQTD